MSIFEEYGAFKTRQLKNQKKLVYDFHSFVHFFSFQNATF